LDGIILKQSRQESLEQLDSRRLLGLGATHDVKPKDPKSLPLFGEDDFRANNAWYSITRGEGRHVELVSQEQRQLISDG
jgi:hypothetical protein